MTTKEPTGNVEQRLLERVRALDSRRDGYIALHLHLSRLQPENSNERLIKAAASILEQSLTGAGGEVFALSNGDIFAIGPRALQSTAKDAIAKLGDLFGDDPLVAGNADGLDTPFCTWRDLQRDYDDLLRMVYERVGRRDPRDLARKRKSVQKEPVRADHITDVERALEIGNIAGFASSQPVCVIRNDTPPEPVYDEYFVGIDDLQQHLLPGVDLRSNRWLFLRLTETLDTKILEYVEEEDRFNENDFSINLNLSTILTPGFQAFEEKTNDRLRGRMIIELQATDIFADTSGFLLAREFLRERGHKVCLDGMTRGTIPFFAAEEFDFDFMKLLWNPHAIDTRDDEGLARLKADIAEIGSSRVILSRCDNQHAIKIGSRLGIGLFQGFAVDKLLNEGAPALADPAKPVAVAAD